MLEEKDAKTIPQMVEDTRQGKMPRRSLMKALAALGLSAAGASMIGGAAAMPLVAPSTPAVHPASEPQQNLQLHQEHLAQQTQGHTETLQHDYALHAVVEDSMYRQPFVGRAAVMARKGVGMAAIADLKIDVTNRLAHGPQVVVEWVASGTHSGDFPGLPASGRPFALRGVRVVVRHEGKIVREAIYYDMQEVRSQLGPR